MTVPRPWAVRVALAALALSIPILALSSPGFAAAQSKISPDPDRRPASPPAAGVLLVVNKSDDNLALVDPRNLKVLAKVPVGHAPHEVVASPNGRLAYVSNYGTRDEPGNSISVVDVPARKVVSTIDLGDYRRPHGLALTRDGRRLYVTVEGSRAALEIDTASERVARVFPTEQQISHMCVLSRDEKKLYVTNLGSRSVSVVNLADGQVSRIVVGEGPEGIDVAHDDLTVWVANRSDGTLTVIDARNSEPAVTVPAGRFPIRVLFSVNGKAVLVTDAQANELLIYHTDSVQLVKKVALGSAPIGVLLEPGGRHAWVAETGADRITRIDLESFEIVGRLTPGREPDGMAWAQAAGRAPGGERAPGKSK